MTVDLDLLLGLSLRNHTSLDQEVFDLLPLIALKLDNLTQRGELLVSIRSGLIIGLFGRNDVAVASKLLLDRLEDLLRVVVLVKTLNSGQRLSSVSLLDTDVDFATRSGLIGSGGSGTGDGAKVVSNVGKGVWWRG